MWRAVIRIDGFACRQEISTVDVSVTLQVHRATAFSHGERTWLTRVEGRLLMSTSLSSRRKEQFGRKHTCTQALRQAKRCQITVMHIFPIQAATLSSFGYWFPNVLHVICLFIFYIGGGGPSRKYSMMLFNCPSLIVNIQSIFQPGVGRFNTKQKQKQKNSNLS